MSLSQAPIVTEQRLTAKDSVSGLGFVATATTIVDGPPRLNVTRNGSSKIQVRWLTNAVGYHLEQKAVFDSTPWNGLTNNLAVIGDEFVVDIGTTSARTFLRLAQ